MKKKIKNFKSKRKGGSRGTISVFLVLILVPCIIVTCLFGDISRVELSKAEAASAGDLAMYSLLSHYDEELKEYYGLVASCQNIEEFYDVTETYFTGMMQKGGVSGEGSDLFAAYLQSLENGNISDFLQVEFTEAAQISEMPNSKLGDNAALLEDSIVEFMKYRGPYELVNNILKELKEKEVLEGVSGADKDQPIVEARQEYADAEGEMLTKAFYVYMSLRCYINAFEETGVPGFDRYQEYEKHLLQIANDFAQITELITKYYAGTDGIRLVSFPTCSLDAYRGRYKPKDIGEKVKLGDKTIYCIDKAKLQKLLKDIDRMIRDVEGSAGNIANACSGFSDPTGANSDINPAIYCMKVQNAVNSSDLNKIADNGKRLMQKYAQLQAALGCEPYPDVSETVSGGSDSGELFGDGQGIPDIPIVNNYKKDDLPSDWKTQISAARGKIEAVQREYLSGNGSSSYMRLVHSYRKTAESNASYPGGMDTIANVKERRYEFYSEYLGRNARIGEFLEKIREEFNRIETDITDQIKRLDTIIYGGSFQYNGKRYKTVSLDKFKELVTTYSSKREDWGSAISSSGSSSKYAQSEKEEYNGTKVYADGQVDKGAQLAYAIGKSGAKSVDILKTRLLNIRKDMQDYLNAVKNFKYGGSQITKLRSRDDVIRAGRSVIPDQTDLSLSANKRAAAGYYQSLLSPSVSQVYKAPALTTGENGNNPDLSVDPPELYEILENQFNQDEIEKLNSEINKNDKRNKEYEEKAKKEKENALNADEKYLKGKGGNLGSSHGGDPVSTLTAIGSIVTVLGNLFSGSGAEMRDQIYVAEYIMDMFSYSSFNLEGQHRLAASDEKVYSLKDVTPDGYPGYTELWAKEEVTETPQNQSLTNQPINAAHNQMNLGEVEYILYGNTNLDENLKTSYKNIFTIREVLNLVSGFQNFYTGTDGTAGAINAIAAAVMSATGGVVPTAVTKCVLIGVIATMETAHDMERLKAGVPVVLYKVSGDDWVYSVSDENVAASFSKGDGKADKNGIYYSDYLYFFLLIGVTNSKTYSSILLRTGDLIEANMQKQGSQADFDLSKSRCYFSIDAKLKVKPLLLDLPIANSMSGVDTKTVTGSSGWCTYKVSLGRGYS